MVQSCLKHHSLVQTLISVFGAQQKWSFQFFFIKKQSYSDSHAVSGENWVIHFKTTVLPNQTPPLHMKPQVGEKSPVKDVF